METVHDPARGEKQPHDSQQFKCGHLLGALSHGCRFNPIPDISAHSLVSEAPYRLVFN